MEVRIARVIGFEHNASEVTGVKILQDGAEEVVEADAVAITMGPWSGEALTWLGLPSAVSGRRAHGIVMRPQSDVADTVTGHALFSEWAQTRRTCLSAEVRPGLSVKETSGHPCEKSHIHVIPPIRIPVSHLPYAFCIISGLSSS